MNLRTVGIVTVAALVAGCQPGETSHMSAVRSDSAGVEIVVSPGADLALDWRFTPRLRLGGEEEGPVSFYEVSAGAVAVDRSGRILVLDRANMRLVAFDAEGRVLWTAGGEGGGPGEFSFPISVNARGDTAVVLDGVRDVELFDAADGRYVATRKLGRSVGRRLPFAGGAAYQYNLQPEGDEGRRQAIAESQGGDTLVIAEVPWEAGEGVRFETCPLMVPLGRVFGAQLVWTVSDTTVLVNAEPRYVIGEYLDGALVRSLRRAVEPLPATAALAAAEFPDGFRVQVPGAGLDCRMSAEAAVSQAGYAEWVPPIRALLVAPDGTVWVRRNPARAPTGRFDILAADGAYRGTLDRAPAPVAFMPNGDVVGIEKDEFDVERVVVYAVSR